MDGIYTHRPRFHQGPLRELPPPWFRAYALNRARGVRSRGVHQSRGPRWGFPGEAWSRLGIPFSRKVILETFTCPGVPSSVDGTPAIIPPAVAPRGPLQSSFAVSPPSLSVSTASLGSWPIGKGTTLSTSGAQAQWEFDSPRPYSGSIAQPGRAHR